MLELSPCLVKWNPVAPVLRRLTAWLPAAQATVFDYYGNWIFDRWAANLLTYLKNSVDAVIGYENSCRYTFRTAKALGIKTVLDAASVHHTLQDSVSHFSESTPFHRRVIAVKNEEIKLADHILTLSTVARQSYLDAGVHAERLHLLPLGVDLLTFRPGDHTTRGLFFTFIFSGKVTIHKGIDFLIQAFKKVLKRYPNVKLRIIGFGGDGYPLVRTASLPQIEWLGFVTQTELAKHYQAADCLVLPSRHDSYGMVVTEALASGLPVIISDRVGAKDIIEEGKNGWVVPLGDIESLADRMLWMVEHRTELEPMRVLARRTAEKYSWDDYQKRLVDVLQTILN